MTWHSKRSKSVVSLGKEDNMRPMLFLAPFENMAQLAKMIAKEMDIPLLVEVVDDEHACAAVHRYAGIEVVISRGGVAERIVSLPHITVVEITMSVNDMLSALHRLTMGGYRKIAVVSRKNIFDGTVGDFHIAQTHISIRSCGDEEEIQRMVAEFCGQGVEVVIGCRMAYETARQYGILAEFLDSSAVSIRKAIEEACRLMRAKEQEKLQAAQLKAIVDNIDEGIIALNKDGEIHFSNNLARRICCPDGGEILKQHIERFLQQRSQDKVVTVNGNKLLARIIPLEVNGVKQGDVIAFQEVANIQDSERKIRLSSYQKGLYAKDTFQDVVGRSQAMQDIIKKGKNYAQYDSNLLIYGETGTGKEILAQSIHNHSKRRGGPFVSVNTASIPPNLLESELFGYVEGAFTGARRGGKQGLFELAHGGTIFLDEIGELSPDIQSRLLRVLQEKEIMRIGDDRIIPVDVRIISATNRDLLALVKQGQFRADLYYRICVLRLRLPPLRERVEDIPELFEYYVNRLAAKEQRTLQIHPAVFPVLQAYPWPGNIRELRNVAEVLVYTEEGTIEASHLIEILAENDVALGSGQYITIPEAGTLKQMETAIVKSMLSRYSADEVCQRLGLSRVTLWRKLK